eukprot:PLAT780.1.p1 GENE.PLAT780.1~~PLAT780.1.p1  ORF type:complete len:452 (+),score=142.63 PLAT780.1:132-1358(+)
MDALMRHFANSGGHMFGCTIKRSSWGGWGLFATRDIPVGETLVAAPPELWLYKSRMEQDELLQQLDARGVGRTDKIAAYLLKHFRLGATSPHALYLRSLPALEDMHGPLFWSEEEKEEMQQSFLTEQVEHKLSTIHRGWSSLQPLLEELRPDLFAGERAVTEIEMRWVLQLFWSRVFGVRPPPDRELEHSGLILVADLVNSDHERRTASFGMDDQQQYFVIASVRSITKGSEIFITYGFKPCRTMLLTYGFCYDHMDDDDARLRLSLPSDDPLYQQKKDILLAWHMWEGLDHLLITYLKPLPKTLLAAARLIVWHDAPITLADSEVLAHPLARDDEARVLQLLARSIQDELAAYATTLAQDRRLWRKRKTLSFAKRMALRLRMGEKIVLRRAAAAVAKAEAELPKEAL